MTIGGILALYERRLLNRDVAIVMVVAVAVPLGLQLQYLLL